MAADEMVESDIRIGVGNHYPGLEFRPALDKYAGSRSPIDLNFVNLGRGKNIHSKTAARSGDGLAEPAHAASHVTPHPACSVAFAHHMMKQHIGRPRSARAGVRADDCIGGQGRLELVALKPGV